MIVVLRECRHIAAIPSPDGKKVQLAKLFDYWPKLLEKVMHKVHEEWKEARKKTKNEKEPPAQLGAHGD